VSIDLAKFTIQKQLREACKTVPIRPYLKGPGKGSITLTRATTLKAQDLKMPLPHV